MNTNVRRLIGSFVFVLAVCYLLLSVFEISNKADHINDYERCISQIETAPIFSETLLDECKDSASQGLGVTFRQTQLGLTTTQYFYIYLQGLIKVLFAVTLLIIGQIIYSSKKEIKPKPVKKIRRKTRRKK